MKREDFQPAPRRAADAPFEPTVRMLVGMEGLELVRRAHRVFGREVALVSSFGLESAVLLDMVASVDHAFPVIFIDTGKLFPETLAYRARLIEQLGLRDVRSVRPDPRQLARHDPDGGLWRRDSEFCCHLRKTEPLQLALADFRAWITGRKRYQGGLRSSLPTVERDPASGLVKLNPLAGWSLDDIRHYRRLRQLPPHPLLLRGYGSVGCVPCTTPVEPGEPVRAGRWRGIDRTECGIHLAPGRALGERSPDLR